MFFLATAGAQARGDDKPKHGGMRGGELALYVEDHDTRVPVPAQRLNEK